MAYGARLESVLGASPRGFESPILRHRTPGPVEVPGFLCICNEKCPSLGRGVVPPNHTFSLSYGTLGDNRGRKYESSTTVGGAFPGSSGVARFRALEASAVRSSPAL